MKSLTLRLIVIFVIVELFFLSTNSLAATAVPQARMQAGAAFYKGKTVEFVVPYNAGGGYDTLARLLAPFLAKNLGAKIIVVNEPGAGAKVALNRLAKESNGLSVVTCSTREAAIAQVYGDKGARFDLSKFNWLGTISRERYAVIVGKKSGYRTIADLQQSKEVKFGSDTRTSGKGIRPLVTGYLFGINVKLVAGYKGTADEMLAVLRGETDGLSTDLTSLLPYIKSNDAIPLLIVGRERYKLLPDTPTIYEVKKLSDREKRVADITLAFDAGQTMATTPGVPRERVAFLEAAVKKTLEDPDVRKRGEKLGRTIAYASPKETAESIGAMLSISGEEKTMFGRLLGIQGY